MGYELTFIALVISLVFTGLTGLYPGGVIVPAYLVLFVEQPARIAGTLIAALLTIAVYRFASRHVILFGRRRFVFMILTGSVWTYIWIALLPGIYPVSLEYRIIGWVIPGLIANNFERQGVAVTTASLITVTAAAYFLGKIIVLF